jgi:hypothetical protein
MGRGDGYESVKDDGLGDAGLDDDTVPEVGLEDARDFQALGLAKVLEAFPLLGQLVDKDKGGVALARGLQAEVARRVGRVGRPLS